MYSLLLGLELVVEAVAKPLEVEAALREKPGPRSRRELTRNEGSGSGRGRRLRKDKIIFTLGGYARHGCQMAIAKFLDCIVCVHQA